MRRTVLCPFLISVALLGASPLAFGRDARPSGDSSDCRDSVITVPSPATTAPTPKQPAPILRKARPVAASHDGGGGDEGAGTPRVPRWHSFLPGMFR